MVDAARTRLARHPKVRAERADAHDLPYRPSSFDAVLAFHTLTYAERPQRVLEECARVLRPGGRLAVLSLDRHERTDVTAPYGERHPGFSPRALRSLVSRTGLDVTFCDVACREAKNPHFQVVLAVAEKAKPAHPRTAKTG